MTADPMVTGCAPAFGGDRTDAAGPVVDTLVARGGRGVLVFEVLAEPTLTLAQLDRRTSPARRCAPLTKRSFSMRNLPQTRLAFIARLPEMWWGVSVENRRHGLPRIDHLRQAPARVRFLSIEPLLEDLGPINLEGIHWVIVGGESGPGARPMDRAWVLSVRDQCQAAGVPFFFKQWGGVRKSKTGRELDGQTYDALPDRVSLPVLENARRLAAIAVVEESSLPLARRKEPGLFTEDCGRHSTDRSESATNSGLCGN